MIRAGLRAGLLALCACAALWAAPALAVLPPSSTALDSAPNPSAFGEDVFFTILVTGSDPTGTVTLFDGATPVGSSPIGEVGEATIDISTLTIGSHNMTAEYSGDLGNAPSTSNLVVQVVNGENTTTTLSSSKNPSDAGDAVTFSAVVSAVSTPTGSVEFFDGATSLGIVTLAGGSASLTTSSLTIGSHSISAVYGGDGSHTGSTSNTVEQVVRTGASVALSSSLNPSHAGDTVTFTATVSLLLVAPEPGGTVTFKDGGTTLATVPVTAGSASYATSALAGGSHAITATYSGDGFYGAATSPTLTQVVKRVGSSVTLSSSQNPAIGGDPVTFTATVGGGDGTPTGTVTFKDGGTTLGSGSLAAGMAKFTTSTLPPGSHTITGAYSGDASHVAATSDPLTQTIETPNNSQALRDTQTVIAPQVADASGAAITNGVDDAINDAFGSGGPVTPTGGGFHLNFAEAAPVDSATDKVFAQASRDWLAWVDLDYRGISSTAAAGGLSGDQLNAIIGLTRVITPTFVLGALGGYETFDYRSSTSGGELSGSGWTGGGYLGWRPQSGLQFDAAFAGSAVDYKGIAGTTTGLFPGARFLVTAGLTGMHDFDGIQVAPSARIYSVWEHENAYVDSLGTTQAARDFATAKASAGMKFTFPTMMGAMLIAPYLGAYVDYRFGTDSATSSLVPGVIEGVTGRVVGGVAANLGAATLGINSEVGGLGSGTYTDWSVRGNFGLLF